MAMVVVVVGNNAMIIGVDTVVLLGVVVVVGVGVGVGGGGGVGVGVVVVVADVVCCGKRIDVGRCLSLW